MSLPHVGSGYWSSDAWDPDNRVYAGAEIYQSYRLAVQEDEPQPHKPEPKEQPKIARGNSAAYWGAMDDQTEEPELAFDILGRSAPKKVSFDGPERGADGAQHELKRGSSDYWASGNWDLSQRLEKKEELDTPSTQSGGGKSLPRKDSNAYWDADQWDPDERVYVGAEAGQKNHLTAVIHADDKLLRAWSGGLSCPSSVVGPVDILKALEGFTEAPELQELYEVTSESVGMGSFGVVRKATHRASETHCVVKSLKKAQSGSMYKSQVESGLYDQLMSMSVRHPHEAIVKYLDMFESEEHYYVVMEDLQGPELLEQMERLFPVTERHCQQVMSEMLAALSHIHGTVGICHRDIKLDNFRYRSPKPGSPLVLLDFGFLAHLEKPWDGKKCGTRMYMAPEVINESVQQQHLAAIDLWAAGVMLYLLFTGDCPIQQEEMANLTGSKAYDLVQKALEAPPLKSTSSEARDLLRRLLELEASKRIAAAEALKHPWFSLELEGAAVPARRGSYRKLATSLAEGPEAT